MKSTLKWKRAAIIFPTDHIVSSKAREVGACRGFKPLYENEPSKNIRFLLSNEYMRLWFKEREVYQKENYVKQEKARNESNLRRGFVQRMLTIPRPNRDLPNVKFKRFQTVISKVDNRRTVEEKTKICERYTRSFEPPERARYKPACTVAKQQKNVVSAKKNVKQKENQSGKKEESLESRAGLQTTQKQLPKPQKQIETPITKNGLCQLVCKLI